MDFNDIINRRASQREFNNRPVEDVKLQYILEAGRLAPTAANYQSYKVLVLNTPEDLEKLREGSRYMYKAPLALIVCGDHEDAYRRITDDKDYTDVDTTIVTTYMMLAASNIGLGNIWIAAFDPEDLRAKFNIPESYEAVNILLVGYPENVQSGPKGKDRKPLEETVVYGSFSNEVEREVLLSSN